MDQGDESLQAAARRVGNTLGHLAEIPNGSKLEVESCSASSSKTGNEKEKRIIRFDDAPRESHHQGKESFKWNGWGYDDTAFELNSKGQIYLTGNHYSLCGVPFPKLRPWAEDLLGINIDVRAPSQPEMKNIAPPIRNPEFEEAIKGHFLQQAFDDKARLFHGHGHTCEDIYRLRYGTFERLPDMVLWPGSHEDVEHIVKAAARYNVVIIPYGGGTSVSEALACPADEKRTIVSLDMHEMNRIKWIDMDSMLACIEAGIVGKDLDAKLAKLGVCLGHEPDSSEWSTLGGWIATRASGMKKNIYGNMEDLLISAKLVTPAGTVEKSWNVPRASTGPDVNELILGSEGTLGVVTEAVVKLRPLPEVQRYGSIVFPNFASGVSFMREVALQRIAPASVRLMDNLQFQLGQMLKPEEGSFAGEWLDTLKRWYVTRYKGFQVTEMVAATLLFEGANDEVTRNQKKIYSLASKFGGIPGGEESGRRGYFLTYMIAYIRDFGFQYYLLSESFETSVPWSQTLTLCERVKERVYRSCKEKGVKYNPFVTCRVTQTYDTGACVYFYFAFVFNGLEDPMRVFAEVEAEARDEILRLGGSLSHHHGVGKLRKQWMTQSVSETGMQMLRGVKASVDPQNIFGNGNLL